MRIDRLYFVISTITVVLGMLTFAAATGSLATGLILGLAIIATLVITTGKHAREVPRWFTSTLGVGVMVYAVLALLGSNANTMVLHIAQTVAALQIVKMLEPRIPRNQAQLLALSGMLTVGSCLTSVGFRMAVALSVYAPLMLASILLFQLYSAEYRAHPGRPTHSRARTNRASLAGVRSVGIATALGIAGVAAGAFITMPRGLLDDNGPATPGINRNVSGFTDHVRLGDQGIITDSEVVVMDVHVLEFDGDRTSDRKPSTDDWKPALPEVLYLRGAVLDTYEPQRRIWTRSDAFAARDDDHYQNPRYLRQLYRKPKDDDIASTFVQKITVRSRTSDHLFALARPDIGGIVLQQGIDEFTFNQLDRTFSLPSRRGLFSYWVRSVPTNDIAPTAPATFPVDEIFQYAQVVLQRNDLERDHQSASTPEDVLIIRAFERHLRNNPEFTYSREMIAPPPGQDPIIHFLRESRSGHCEYYASALAALCKSVGIHARVITGYAASEYNPQDGSYTVRESNAHAWVEAMVEPGRWETFDASPAEEVRYGREGPKGIRAVWLNLNESVRFAWLKWVVGFGESDQINIFRLDEGGPFGIFKRIRSAARSTGLISHQPLPRLTLDRAVRAASWALATLVASLAVLYGVHWLLERLVFTRAFLPTRRLRRRRARTIYEMMLAALDRADLAKPGATPPLTHAHRLASIDRAVAEDVRAITQWYYAGRFGGAPGDDTAAANRLESLRSRLALRV